MLTAFSNLIRLRAASTSSVPGRLVPLGAANLPVDLSHGGRRFQLYEEESKEQLVAARQQRRLVAGLAGLPVSALPRWRTRRFTLPQMIRALEENQAVALRVYGIRQVVASAASLRHLQAITTNVAREARSRAQNPWAASQIRVEGEAQDEWTCLDLTDIMLHLMSDAARARYDIESRYRQFQMYGDPLPEIIAHEDDDNDDDAMEYRTLR